MDVFRKLKTDWMQYLKRLDRFCRSGSKAILVLILVTPISVASSHDDVDLFSLSLEELLQLKVTSSSFDEEAYLESSSTVSLVTQGMWDQRGDRRLSDVFMHLPSTLVQPYLAGGSISMRGYSSISSVRGTATVFDGVPLNGLAFGTAQYQMENLELAMLDNIEVVRGGASTLYGADAFHGAISLNSFSSDTNLIELDEGYSSNEYYRHQLRASHNLGRNQRMNFAFGASGRDDQDKSLVYTDPTDEGQRTSSMNDSYDSQSLLFNVSGESEDSDYSYELTMLTDKNEHSDAIGIGRFFFNGQNLLLDRDLASTETQFDLSKIEIDYHIDDDASFALSTYYWQSELMHDVKLPVVARQQTITEESRTGVIGSYMFYSDALDSDFSVRLNADKIVVDKRSQKNFNDGEEENTSEIAVTGEGDYRRVHGAAFQGKSYFQNRSVILLYGLRHELFSDIEQHTSPKGGVIYKLSSNQAIKLLYGHAYRPPTTVELRGIGLTKGNTQLNPEVIDSYEIIYLKDDDQFRMELTGFYTSWRDGIVQVPCEAGSQCQQDGLNAQYQNLNKNSSKGVELSVTSTQDQFQGHLSMSYVQSVNEVEDIDFSAFPEFIINAEVGCGFADGLGQVYWSNRMHFNGDEAPQTTTTVRNSLKNYYRSDIHVSYDLEKNWRIKLDVRNVFDRSNFLPSIANSENGVPAEDRSILMSVRYQFRK